MKEFIRFLMYDPKHSKEKVSDRMLSVKVGFSVVMILFCVAMMSLSAYAFFTHNMTTQVDSIRAASFKLDIASEDGLAADESGLYTLDNSEGDKERIFVFTLTKAQESTATIGYCKIGVITDMRNPQTEDGTYLYYSKPIGSYLEEGNEVSVSQRLVRIRVAPFRSAKVFFSPQWGSTAEEPLESSKYAWPGYSALTAEEQALIAGTNEPAEQENEAPADQQTDLPAETPSETPAETPSETPVETPSENSVETPLETPVDTSTEPPADTAETGETTQPTE